MAFATDTFASCNGDINGDSLSGGGTWTHSAFTDLSDGQLTAGSSLGYIYQATTGVDCGYYCSPSPANANYDVQLDIVSENAASFTNGHGMGVMGRVSTSAATGYILYVDWHGLYLYKIVNGTYTSLGSYAFTAANNVTYTLKLEMRGTTIKGYLDGTERISVTDSSITAAGKAGIYAYNAWNFIPNNGWRGDNFSATDEVITPVSASDSATATDSASVASTIISKSASDSAAATDAASGLLATIYSSVSGWLTNWTRRVPIVVTGHRSALTNYPVKVTLTYDADMQADFDDVRFTSSDGTTALTYWLDHYTASTSAVFWVVMPTTPGNGLTSTIFAYYGNGAASYGGTTYGASAVFSNYDGGSVSAIPNAATYSLQVGSSGAWDDSYIFNSRFVRNLDGSLYKDGSGYAYILYIGSNAANRATAGGVGDDRPGFYKTQDFSTFTKLTTSAPALNWDAGTWHPTDGAYWNGRVVQPFAVIWDGSQFIMFTDGDRGPAHVVEDYTQGVYTASSITGTWTQDAGNPTFQSGHAQASGYNDSIAYGGDVLYDPDEPDSDKRWKTWYTGLNVDTFQWGVMYATAPAYNGPWTRHSTSYIFQPLVGFLDGGIYGGGVDRVFKLRGIYYMLYERYGTPSWTTYLAMSTDGINWTTKGSIFTKGGTGAWDSAREYWTEVGYDPAADVWRLMYTGSNGGTVYSGGTDVPDLKIGSTSWPATRPPQADDPTTSVGAEQSTAGPTDTATATDSGSKSVTIGLATLSASDSASVSDSGSAYVPVTPSPPEDPGYRLTFDIGPYL